MIKTIVSSSLSGSITQIVTAMASLISLPILVSALGKNAYGMWILIGYSLHFLAMSDMGIINSVGRLVAKYKTDNRDLHSLLYTVIILLIVIGTAIGICTVFASSWIPQLLNIDSSDSEIAQQIFIIGGLFLAVTIPLRIGNGILAGFQCYTTINNSQSILSILNLSLIVLLNYLGSLGLIELIYLYSLNSLAVEFFRLFSSLHKFNFSMPLFHISRKHVREIIDLGSSSILTTLTAFGYRQGIVICSAHMLSVAEAGVFGICLTIMSSLSKLLSQLSVPLVTLVSERQGQNTTAKVLHMNNLVVSISFGLALSIFFGIIAYSDFVLYRLFEASDWQENDYLASYNAIVIMAGSLAIGIPQMGSRATLLGSGKHWLVAKITFIGSLISLFVAITTMSFLGILGAAIGWSTIWILQGVIIYPPMVKKHFKQSYISMFVDSYLPGALSAIIVASYLWVADYWFNPAELVPLITSIIIAALLGTVSLFFIHKAMARKNYHRHTH